MHFGAKHKKSLTLFAANAVTQEKGGRYTLYFWVRISIRKTLKPLYIV
jgi:hypothetical protein